MKHIRLTALILSLLLLCGAFAACAQKSPNRGDPFVAYEIESMRFVMTGANTYEVAMTANIGEELQIYVTDTDLLDMDQAYRVDAQKVGEEYRFTLDAAAMERLTRRSKDLYFWAVSGEREALLPITLPSINPFLQVNEEEQTAVLYFGLDGDTSWSSYCDPSGKSVYRSASATWDDSAECVDAGIEILAETCADWNYDAAKPYYYLVLTAKNGAATFVSYPLGGSGENIVLDGPFRVLSVAFTADGENGTFVIDGRYAEGTQIGVRINNVDAHVTASDGYFKAEYSLASLTQKGKWYDIHVYYAAGKYEDIDISKTSVNMNRTLDTATRSYALAEWENALKVYFEEI